MDAKSLAKSKRAHSLHHSKKPHAIQKAKASSGGTSGNAGSGNKALGKQIKEKAQLSALPSNWDRYEDEFEGSEGTSGGSVNKDTDVSFPKSKGADYRDLIAEAQSQHQSDSCLDSFLSLDDIFPGDFKIGVGPILSVRGEGLLSWIGDDNFVVEDETVGNPEAPYLSLNLNALAEQLEKVNLSDRLYIEADLLPPELAEDHGSTKTDRPELDRMQTGATESGGLTLRDLSNENKVEDKITKTLSSQSSVNVQTNFDSSIRGSSILNQTTGVPNSKPNSSCVAAQSMKLMTFEAATAEAELDMLLDSFSDTKLLDSPGRFAVSRKDVLTAQPQFTGAAPSSSKTNTFATGLDNVLDDLLEETSNASNQNVSHNLGKQAPTAQSQFTGTAPSSLRTIAFATGLDNALDDLLEEASNASNQNVSHNLGKPAATSSEIQSSSSQSVSGSKVLDDFDSWLDTI